MLFDVQGAQHPHGKLPIYIRLLCLTEEFRQSAGRGRAWNPKIETVYIVTDQRNIHRTTNAEGIVLLSWGRYLLEVRFIRHNGTDQTESL